MENKAPVLFLALTALIALSGLGIRALAGPSREPGRFPDAELITATDLHYLSPALTDHGAYFEDMIRHSDGKVMDRIEELTDAFLDQVLEAAPDALILTGDLTFNGARQSHEALARKLEALTRAGIPVLVIPGNHDLENRDAARFQGGGFTRIDSITPEGFAELYAACGYDGALSRDPASLSYVYEIKPGLRALMLDVNMPGYENLARPETLTWAEAQLREAKAAGAKVLSFSHQNLARHNSLIVDGYLIRNAGEILDLYNAWGVTENFCGHLHCQHIRQTEGVYDIATASLAVCPNQYGRISLSGTGGRYDTVPVDVSSWAEARGLTDPELLDFSGYSREFFRASGRDTAPENYAGLPDGAAVAAFIADVNQAYFSGRMDAVDMEDPMFDRLLSLGGFMGAYLSSTREDGPADMNHLTF